MTDARTRADQVRDLIMLLILVIWLVYACGAVIQLFTSGASVLESLPPFWFWGIPIAPYTALYQPWRGNEPGVANGPGAPPEPPGAPATPGAP